ncbi:MAG TPA: acyltransferase [Steroidobacteraceae bacterium]
MPTDKNFHIASLDGIRAVAAMLVFAAHAGNSYGWNLAPGGFGVTIFFFLSGYLITTLLRLEKERTKTISLRRFYLRRAYRILPPMYVLLTLNLILALIGVLPSDLTVGAVAAQFAHLSNYYMLLFGEKHIVPGTGVMWSLAVEEHFYLLYPMLLLFLLGRLSYKHTAVVLLGLCALVLVWRCYLVFGLSVPSDYTYEATDTRFDSLLYGCIMGIALNPALDDRALTFSSRTWFVLLTISGAVLAFCFWYRSDAFRATVRYSLQGIALFPLFFCAIRYSRWPLFAWLNFAWIRGLGIVSYSFYLVHLTTLSEAATIVHQTVLAPSLGFAMAVLYSVAMYFLVEKHLGILRHRLHR